jgi:Arc/MetJ-type ribon-helix-helix transcriptional regulator
MPNTKRKAISRKNVRIPEPLMDEVDRIVRESGLYINRQQFIESAIREKIEESKLSEKIGDDFAARIKDKVLIEDNDKGIVLKPLPSPNDDLGSLKPFFKGKTARELLEESRKDELTKEKEWATRARTSNL